MTLLDGRRVLVLGGSSGMGQATAEALGRLGAHVIVAARRTELCVRVVQRICAAGGTASAAHVDVLDESSVDQLFAQIAADHGRLDGAFNNVGRTLGAAAAHETPIARLRETLELNLVAISRCLQHELRLMRAQPARDGEERGAIVNNSSIGGTRGFAQLSDYCAAKWGLIGLSKSAALENAALGIRINVIAPGLVATERFEAVRAQHAATIDARLAEIPMRRPARMEEIAATVCWLLGPGCGFLTGAVIPLDGGECAR